VKVALIQLPLQSHDYAYSRENIPLAAGCLASYASSGGVPAEVLICPQEIANLGGDEAILRWLEALRPDMVGFSCYLWNIQRTLFLCSSIRQRLQGCLIVLGGPEVTPDNAFLLAHELFDVGVVGEGEDAFAELLRAAACGMRDFPDIPGLLLRRGSGFVFTGKRGLMRNLDAIPSPYLGGMLAPGLNRGMVMETVRGCPMRCAYCYYHKSAPVVRAFSRDRVANELRWAVQGGIDEVTLIDPCFGRRPDLMGLLGAMARERSDSMGFSCELNAEDLTLERVEAFRKAGLCHVEIGLQSTNPAALRTVGRRFHRESFIRGVRMLRSAEVRVMTDVMVGLPGDSLGDVKRSIDFVLEEGLCDDLSLYPLSVLPGTKLRALSEVLGINYQQEPPYLALKTRGMDCRDIREAFSYAKEVAHRDYFPVELPVYAQGTEPVSGCMVNRIVVDGTGRGRPISPADIGQALCIEVQDSSSFNTRFLEAVLRPLLAANPFTLVSWIIPEEIYRPCETLELISPFVSNVVHPADREYMAAFSPRRSTQLFLRGMTRAGGSIYTRMPIPMDPASIVWAALPAEAGEDDERAHTARMESLLGFPVDIEYHDLVPGDHGLRCLGQIRL